MTRPRAAMLLLLTLAGLAAASTASTDDEARPITHENLWLMPRTSSPQITPDGRHAVVAVSRPAYDPDESESHLMAGRDRRQRATTAAHARPGHRVRRHLESRRHPHRVHRNP